MSPLLVAGCGALGLLIGSFLTVVIARVPQRLSVVRPGSACACGTSVAPWDNVPVLSWFLLRGRARCCGRRISARYPLVEAGTALAFSALAAWQGPAAVLPALLYLAAVSIALTVIDVELKRLPDALTLTSYPIGALLLGAAAFADDDLARLLPAAACGLGMWALYLLLMLINPRGMGYGDVKLAGVLGMYLGFFGVGHALVGAFLAFVLGGLLGLGLIAARLATRSSAIPFGPFMLAGAWLGLVVGGPVSDWYLGGLGL